MATNGQLGLGLCGALFALGCGGAPQPAPPPRAAGFSGWEQPVQHGGGMTVEGILGTIPQRRIEETLQAQLPAFQRCFADGQREVEMLEGYMKFYFRVGLDGHVEWVEPRSTSVGHRPTELCLLEVARAVTFPVPRGGGPAEFSWGFEIEGVRSAVVWEAQRVSSVVEEHKGELAACGLEETGHYVVTTYVTKGGQVLSAGAATDADPHAEHIDCVIETVRAWKFPDPGALAAKVTFPL